MEREYINNYIKNFLPYKSERWCYEDGILMNAVLELYLNTKEARYLDFVKSYFDLMIESNGNIKNYELEEFNIDNIAGGLALVSLYDLTKEEKYKKACDLLYKQITQHPRTKENCFWHKKIYPNQVWMDGIYMGLVFYARYISYFKVDDKGDIMNQLRLLRKNLYNEEKKLFVHAYDETRTMQWADMNTGMSHNVWSRACGWVAMALVDIYETNIKDKEQIIPIYLDLINGLKPHIKKGMIFQVVDCERYPGNYLETSGSAMVAYSLMKAYRLNMLDRKAFDLGLKVYNCIKKNYLKKDYDGYHLGGICRVAGLDNARRNGNIDYYLSEEIALDEVKGVAPFILAYREQM